MKSKIIILVIFSMLLIGSVSVDAASIKNTSSKTPDVNLITTDEVTIDVGDMTIDCYWDGIACEIDVPDSPHREINPQGSEKVTINFYADWHIKNQKLGSNEKWYFKLTLKKGNSPDSPVLSTVDITVDDTLGGIGGPSQSDGTLYVDSVELGRLNFDKDGFFNEPGTLKYRAELYCEYYRGGLFSEPTLMDDADLWTVARIDLANERPSKPTLSSNDISEGGSGSIDNTYSFTATGSIDPDGDSIKYSFDFHDGTVVDSVSGSVSHKWNDDSGGHSVSVYAVDRFGRLSDGTTMTFTLPRAKSLLQTNLEQYPALARLLNYPAFSKLL